MTEPTYTCTNGTHHLACDCREAQFAHQFEHLLVKYNDAVNENEKLKKELAAKDAEIAHKVKMCVELSGLLDKALAEKTALREVLKGVYDTLTRELAEPKGSETVAMILCCTAIEAALTGEKGKEDSGIL
jgi:hypothetical protein